MTNDCICSNVPRIWRLAGVTRTVRLTVTKDGSPYDFTGLQTVLRIDRDNSDFHYEPQFTVEGDDNNIIVFTWAADKQPLGDYTIEVTVTDGSGNKDRVNWHGATGVRLVEYSNLVKGEDAAGVESDSELGLDGIFTMNGVGMDAYEEWLADGNEGSLHDYILWMQGPAREAAEAAEATMTEIQSRADDDHTTAGSDHTRAAADHTTAESDHTRADEDHQFAFENRVLAYEDHLRAEDDHTTAAADHTTAQADHAIAGSDHTRAEADHSTAASDHTTAASDHTKAGQDSTRAGSDHDIAVADHAQAEADHTRAEGDHTTAAADHTTAAADHTQAASDHTTAAADHTQAVADHAVMAGYDTRLTNVETDVTQLGQKVNDFYCFGRPRPDFYKTPSGWGLKINSGVVAYIHNSSLKTIAATDLALTVGTVSVLLLNVSTGAISSKSYSATRDANERVVCSYYFNNTDAPFNPLYVAFEYTINGEAFGITQKPTFSFFGARPNFVKTSNGWSLVIGSGATGIVFSDGAYPIIPATNLPLSVGAVSQIICDKQGNISTQSTRKLTEGQFLLGSYIIPNNTADLNISPAFEYTKDGIPFGIEDKDTIFSVFGTRPDFYKTANGWSLKITGGQFAIFVPSNKIVSVQATDLELLINTIAILVFNIDTGVVSTRFRSALAENELLLGSYYFNNASAPFNCQPLFEYTVNGNPFGIEVSMTEPDINPVLPNDIFLSDDMPTPIFQKSLYSDPTQSFGIVATTMANGRLKTADIGNPCNLSFENVGDSIRFTFEKRKGFTNNIFKVARVHKTSVSTKSGRTTKILMIGDSITHGNLNAQSSPIVKMNELLPSWYNVTASMIGTFAPRGVTGEGRGCFSWEALVGLNNNPYGEFHFPSVGGDLEQAGVTPVTTQFQNPFTFPATATDKANHPEWCFTNNNNYADEPDGLSYADATAEQKTSYHFFIFDFARYIGLWNDATHTPDIITIALGTNDWQPSGLVDVDDIELAVRIFYAQVRALLPSVKIVVVSSQGVAITLQTAWENEIMPVVLRIQKLLDEFIGDGDNNIYELPLYACSSRWLSFDGNTAGTPTDISEDNNTQHQTIDTNVHLLDGVGSDGYWQYMNGLITCLINLV